MGTERTTETKCTVCQHPTTSRFLGLGVGPHDPDYPTKLVIPPAFVCHASSCLDRYIQRWSEPQEDLPLAA